MKPTETRFERFRREYAESLRACIIADPTAYRYGLDAVEDMANRMTLALSKGEASIAGPATKMACRKVGIKCQIWAIKLELADKP